MHFVKIVFVFLAAFAAYSAAEPGSILVRNTGGYVAKFTVQYDLNGEMKTESSGDFGLGVNKEIAIPDGATDLSVKVELYWFPGQLTTVFAKSYSGPVNKCFKIWGTTLNSQWSEEDCS